MSEQRHLKIHFNDGTMLRFDFPAIEQDGLAAAHRIDEILSKSHLILEAEGALLMFPLTSVKYVESFPAPRNLPGTVIRGARLVRPEA